CILPEDDWQQADSLAAGDQLVNLAGDHVGDHPLMDQEGNPASTGRRGNIVRAACWAKTCVALGAGSLTHCVGAAMLDIPVEIRVGRAWAASDTASPR